MVCSKEVFSIMSNSLYNGTSEGFNLICDGYIAYSKEIIARRSVPDLRDGLKPVTRRIIYACSENKNIYNNLIKCARLVGGVMSYHPHGDSSVYGALCNMTNKSGSMNVPLFIGQGEFGKVFSTGTPAAMRYTKAKFAPTAEDYLRDMIACNMVPAEEGDGLEPEILPVRYPSVLVNGTSGMAVSVSTVIPSFNMLDVINITQEYLKTGKIETIITPDFPTGGIIVKDGSELSKIMHTGKGKIKVRAKVEIKGKDILVKEVPFGKTVEGIIKSINSAEIQGVQVVRDSTGSNTDTLVTITCKSMKIVESVLMHLYKLRILQTTVPSNMLFVEKEEPVITGVYGVIDRWVAWRREVIKVKFRKMLEPIEPELNQLSYFMRLVENEEWKANMLDKLAYKSREEGKAYLKEIFEDITDDVCNWIIKRDVPAYNKGDRYAKRYADLLEAKKLYEGYLNDIDSYIYEDLEELKSIRKDYFARKSTETYLDYRFSSISENEVEDDSFCVYTVYTDGFITKTRDDYVNPNKKVLTQIMAQANSTLVGFDCYGRLLRVYGTDIDYTPKGGNGEYLHKYFGVEGYDDYRIVYLGLLDGKTRMLVYKDGYVGFLDTSEWVGKKKTRVITHGVDTSVYNMLAEVYEEQELNEYLIVAEDSGKEIRFGVARVKDILVKSRRSRTRVFGGNNVDIKYLNCLSYMELVSFMEDPFHFTGRMRPLKGRQVYGNAEAIMKDARYYNCLG